MWEELAEAVIDLDYYEAMDVYGSIEEAREDIKRQLMDADSRKSIIGWLQTSEESEAIRLMEIINSVTGDIQ